VLLVEGFNRLANGRGQLGFRERLEQLVHGFERPRPFGVARMLVAGDHNHQQWHALRGGNEGSFEFGSHYIILSPD
jgi:hypothetical protein